MKISDCMTTKVQLVTPAQTIQEAAELMIRFDAGALPVGDDDRLVGMLTDRDIAIRAIGEGKGPQTPIHEVMSNDVRYCFEDESIEHVARNMGAIQVRRLPVLNRSKRLVGIVTLGDIAINSGRSKIIGQALGEVSRTGGQHNQVCH